MNYRIFAQRGEVVRPNAPNTAAWTIPLSRSHPMRTIDARITNAIAKFPATFGLKGHDGTFRISPESSYISTGPFNPYVVLYTQRLRDGVWQDFAKGTSEELAGQVRV